jgi:protein disulfide-isomerase
MVVVALAANRAMAQGLEWTTDLAAAQRAAAQTNRLVLIHFGGPWCKPCREMEEQVFAKAGLSYAVMPNFVPVKVEVQYGEQNELVRQLGVTGFPSDIIMTPQGAIVARSTGFKAAPEYLSMLNQAAQSARAQQPAASSAPPSANVPPPMPAQVALPPRAAAPVAPMNPPPGAASPLAGGQPPPRAAVQPPVAPVSPAAPPVAVPPAGLVPRGVGPVTAAPIASPVAVPPSALAPAVVPSTPPLGAAPPPAPPVSPSPAAAGAPSSSPNVAGQSDLPPGSPPLALDGYCPVTVTEKMIWKKGDVRFGAIHRGRTYLFASATEQAKFLARPDSFSPIMSGNDPVAWLEQGKSVPGRRDCGVMVRGANLNEKMILFASEESREKFRNDQKRYEFEIKQAMQSVEAGGTLRR